jgi:hypothetical protein
MLGALAWWGATRGGSTAAHVALAIAAPLAAAVVWGLFCAPRRAVADAPVAVRAAAEIAAFGAAALALVAVGHPLLGLAFAVACAADRAALAVVDR